MEKTIDQVQEVGSSVLDTVQRVAEVVGNALKPGIETALPIVQQAGEEALKIASPAISEASKKAQEALQSSGVDTEPVMTAAKVYFLNSNFLLSLGSLVRLCFKGCLLFVSALTELTTMLVRH